MHTFAFDPAYGYDVDALLAVPAPEPPADFDAFWRDRHTRAGAVTVAPEVGPLEAEIDGVRVHGITYTSTGGFRVGGWLTLPADGVVTRGLVVVHGYGGRQAPELRLTAPGMAAIWPCARGLGDRSLSAEVPAPAGEHVLHGIAARDTYVHGDCAADVWCAATALLEVAPGARHAPAFRLDYVGTSFGGGIGALALPWDDRFTSGVLVVPSFGNIPLRLTMPCVGSGAAVRDYHARHPEVVEVLKYFDAASAATRLRIPMMVAAARFDPAVPPPGQFAVYNGLAGPKELFTLEAGHVEHEGEAAEQDALRRAVRRFLDVDAAQPDTGFLST